MTSTIWHEQEAGEKARGVRRKEIESKSQTLRKSLANSNFLDFQKMKKNGEMHKLGYQITVYFKVINRFTVRFLKFINNIAKKT